MTTVFELKPYVNGRRLYTPVRVHLPRIKWTKENVVDYIVNCRKANGIPIFKTSFGGVDFELEGGAKAVLATCWGGKDGGSFLFVDVPKDEFEELKKRTGDWKYLINKYAPGKIVELMKYPVILETRRRLW